MHKSVTAWLYHQKPLHIPLKTTAVVATAKKFLFFFEIYNANIYFEKYFILINQEIFYSLIIRKWHSGMFSFLINLRALNMKFLGIF